MTSRFDAVIPLEAATDVETAGAKAAVLARATADGYCVPRGVVIPADTTAAFLADPPSSDVLVGLLDDLGGTVAVRSSAVEEDGAHASFAGQYETVLHVSGGAELVEAVQRCASSASTDSAARYREYADVRGSSIAVLVQRMLRPTAAGVAFSADPVTGDERVVIEATGGLGDALLAGETTGERWVVDEHPTAESGSPSVLDASQATEIAALCRSLAAWTNGPVDVEWGVEEGRLWLLQVRPITALPVEPTSTLPPGQTFLREPRVQVPLRPLSFSSWLPIHSEVFRDVFAEFGVPIAGLDNRHHLGRVYTRTVPLIDNGKDGSDPPAIVLKVLFRLLPKMRRRIAAALDEVFSGPRSATA